MRASTGWKCPGCSACYAPSVTECHRCAPQFTTSPWPSTSPAPFWPAPQPITVTPIWIVPLNPWDGGIYCSTGVQS